MTIRSTRFHHRPLTGAVLVGALAAVLTGCGQGQDAATADGDDRAVPASADAATGPDRPRDRTDTIQIEGVPQALSLRLFRTPDDAPLPFTAYVPGDMAVETGPGTVHFTAEFGGTRSEDAFVHFMVHPEGTDRETALATGKAYKTGRGLPVSQGLEVIADDAPPPHLEWAMESYRFHYQSQGDWFGGTLGVGRHGDRFFQIVRHYPVEFEEGFAPRADLIIETWRWADGPGLGQADGGA